MTTNLVDCQHVCTFRGMTCLLVEDGNAAKLATVPLCLVLPEVWSHAVEERSNERRLPRGADDAMFLKLV